MLQYIKKESKFGLTWVLLSADGSGRQKVNNVIIAKLLLKILDVLTVTLLVVHY